MYDSAVRSLSEWIQIYSVDKKPQLELVVSPSPDLMCLEETLSPENTVRVRDAPKADGAELRQIGEIYRCMLEDHLPVRRSTSPHVPPPPS